MLQTMGLRTGRSKKSDKFRLFQQPARFQPVLGHTFRPITAKAIAGLIRPGTRPGANTRAEAGAWRGERIGCDTYRIITDFP
jgi:hypothetical protein